MVRRDELAPVACTLLPTALADQCDLVADHLANWWAANLWDLREVGSVIPSLIDGMGTSRTTDSRLRPLSI